MPDPERGAGMRRREFIAALGGAAAVAARARAQERARRLGVLMNLAADDAVAHARLGAFLQGLQQLGWIDGRNVRIDYPLGRRRCRSFRKYAAELVALAPDVILAASARALGPLQSGDPHRANRVREVADPVGGGFVDEPGAAGRQHHRICRVRLQLSAANGWSCSSRLPRRDASGGPSGTRARLRERTVWRHPDARRRRSGWS